MHQFSQLPVESRGYAGLVVDIVHSSNTNRPVSTSRGHRWLIERRRVGPLVRELRRATDPLLFRQAGIDLDGEGNR
jgi:hypothetical protein